MSRSERSASWAELLRPRSDGTGDAYWGLRVMAEHSSLDTRPQVITKPDGRYVYSAGLGRLRTSERRRSYVLDAGGDYRVHQWIAASGEFKYYGPNAGFAAGYGPGPQDESPGRRFGWPALQFVGGRDFTIEGCGALVTTDVATPYMRDAWAPGDYELPLCIQKVQLSRCDGAQCQFGVIAILEPQRIEFIGTTGVSVSNLAIHVPLAELQTRFDRATPYYEVGSTLPVWNDVPGVRNARCATAAEYVLGTAVTATVGASMTGHAVGVSNSRSLTLDGVRIRGGYDTLNLGSNVLPTSLSTTSTTARAFGRRWLDIGAWAREQIDSGGAVWRYSSEALTDPLCAQSCATLDTSVLNSYVAGGGRDALTLGYTRRTTVRRSMVALASAADSSEPSIEELLDGSRSPQTRSYFTTGPSAGADQEPNDSRELPRVHTTDFEHQWWYDNGECERFRAGDTVVFDSLIAGNLGQALTFQGHWGNIDDVRIVRSMLMGASTGFSGHGNESILTSGATRTDIFQSIIWDDDRQLNLWGDGTHGIFAQNVVRLGRDTQLGFAADFNGTCSGSDCVSILDGSAPAGLSCGDPGNGEPTPYAGPSPFSRCIDARAASSNDNYATLVPASAVFTDGGSESMVVPDGDERPRPAYLPRARGYDVGWPLLDEERPVRAVVDNTFIFLMGNEEGESRCYGQKHIFAADVLRNNTIYIMGDCSGSHTGNVARARNPSPTQSLVRTEAPTVTSLVQGNTVLWYPSGTRATCGNGQVDPGEECDDGNDDDSDACLRTCALTTSVPGCGNHVVDAGEDCDDALAVCTPRCTLRGECGNGYVDDDDEQCDDGNVDDGDGCSSSCALEAAGAARVTLSEVVISRAAGTSGMELFNGNTFSIATSAISVSYGSATFAPTHAVMVGRRVETWGAPPWPLSAGTDLTVTLATSPTPTVLTTPILLPAAGEVTRLASVPEFDADELVEVEFSSPGEENGIPVSIYVATQSQPGSYFTLDEGVWNEPGNSDWRLLPAPALEDIAPVRGRADSRLAEYEALAVDEFADWSAGVAFPTGRFSGVPTVCVEMPPGTP
ncbi:MAG: hypothetical protein H6699_09375 [Myxococcales bacterium]|nr:hypothetical protein [Myxococcales bacterium]